MKPRLGVCVNHSSDHMSYTPEAPKIWPRHAPSSVHVMAKPTGAICNLDCQYCFFLSKDTLYPESDFRMPDDLLEAYVRQVIESQRSPQVTIAWQGGEPTLMGLDFFRRANTLARAYLRPGTTLEHTIQTNGTLIDDEWCEFLAANGFLVGLSIDGPQAMHDAYRVNKAGDPTFSQVMRAARLMQRHGVEFNVLCTVHNANVGQPLEVYRFFRDEVGTQYVQFIPIVERTTPEMIEIANAGWGDRNHRRPLYTQNGNAVTERTVKPEQWGAFLIGVFDEWVARDVGTVFIQLFESALASWLGCAPIALHLRRNLWQCVGAGAQRRSLLLRPFCRTALPARNIKEQHLVRL